MRDWSDPTDNVPPGPISNPIVENLNGGARITYQLPSDKDLLGVKAIYSLTENGGEREAYSSALKDTIILEGFPDTNERIVKLICIDKSRNESEPVEVIVNPLTIPVKIIGESLTAIESFGGVFVSWDNELKENIGIALYAADSLGILQHNYTYYTNEPEGRYSFRGFNNEEREFRIEVIDRWDNYIVALDTILTPLFEEKIKPYNENGVQLWRQYGINDGTEIWRGDAPKVNQDMAHEYFDKAFDGNPKTQFSTGNKGYYLDKFTGNEEDKEKLMNPIYWILDLGRSCYLSRHVNWVWDHTVVILSSGCPRVFQLWGTNEEPKGVSDFENQMESLAYWTSWPAVGGTDAWKEDWSLLTDYVMTPPSGATRNVDVTEEDKAWARANGFDIEFPSELTNKPFRYIRFVIIETWGGSNTMVQNGDWEFYGQELE